MTFRVISYLSVVALGFVASASAQNYDYFLPRSSTWDERRAYQVPVNDLYGTCPRQCSRANAWDDRSSNFRPASYTYPASVTPTAWGPPAYVPPTYNASAYPSCNPAPYPAPAPYPSGGMGYRNNLYVGQGLFGQPRAFVRNEPVRNFFRFLLP